ncbi:hypothetical protein [Schlesneria paludicola]|uniref:hypothetical protein n=1 Tax=Schlesneria paludicola TaxID=360056 RepID=UPI0012FA94DE|nr:hypothetical protein [Schlesneria paludicola]
MSGYGAEFPKTVSGVKRELLESHEKRHALYVEYRFARSTMIPVTTSRYVRRVIAADRQGHFYLDNGHEHDSMEWEDDPYRKIAFVGPNGTQVLRPLDRVVDRYPAPVSPSFLHSLPGELMLVLGWWPFLDVAEHEMYGHKRSIEEVAADADYALRDEQEVIGGRNCDVIEIPHVDVLWVDSDHGGLVRRRELYDVPTGALALTVEFDEYRDVRDGAQIPMSIRTIAFDYTAQSPEGRLRHLNHLHFKIDSVRANDDASILALADITLPGVIQRINDDQYSLVTEGEQCHAQSLKEWARRLIRSSQGRSDVASWSRLGTPIAFFLGGLIAGTLGWFFRRIACRVLS